MCEKLDRLRISSPKLLPKMRGFSALSSTPSGSSSSSLGRTSPSILIRRTKSSSCPTLPCLSIDPHLVSPSAGGSDYDRVPLAPRSDGSSANGSVGSWVGSVHSSIESMEGVAAMASEPKGYLGDVFFHFHH